MANSTGELAEKILNVKRERNAVILAHNYQRGEVQDIADFVGDSLELSQNAARSDADVIVFCGVHFMAETASILCPEKAVLLPDMHAGCPMANMVTVEKLRERKKELPDATVVCYVNSTAEVKAESDICCTSANALKVIETLESKEVLFVPDQYLGHYISTRTDKKIVLWPGYCPTHIKILPEHITELSHKYPSAKVVVHPECRPDVIALADEVLSTGGMCQYARRQDVSQMIVGTEVGIIHRLAKENPGKEFIPASGQAVCPNMKLITLEKVLQSLEEMKPQVKVPEETRLKARAAVDKMLEAV
ncbi:MAG: quinolinate synthase NadA [Deltaproteobacteria bacterium]|nr:MAG: quinolinate synthase NadA [Deltaproteobacteria bacterium]